MATTRQSVADEQPAVLVPVDFSADSEAALLFACRLAEGLRAPMLVLHVVHDPGDAPGYYHVEGREDGLRRLEDTAKEMLDEFLARMSTEHAEVGSLQQPRRTLVVGLPVTRILEVVEREQPLMVVMGSAGRTGLKQALLGSKAEQVVRLCPVPVTIVKAPRGG